MTRRIIAVFVIVVMAIAALLAMHTSNAMHTSTHHAMHTSTHGTIVQIPMMCQFDTMQVNCNKVTVKPYAQVFVVQSDCYKWYCASTVLPVTAWNPNYCIFHGKAMLGECTVDSSGNIIIYFPAK